METADLYASPFSAHRSITRSIHMLEKEIGGIEEIGEIIIELVHDDAVVSILTPAPFLF